jgi:hypothetical protein
MRRIAWADAVRVLGLLVTAFFFVGAVLQTVIAFELTGGPLPPPLAHDPIQEFTDAMAWDNGRWPMEFAATALLALGFMALGGLCDGGLLADTWEWDGAWSCVAGC